MRNDQINVLIATNDVPYAAVLSDSLQTDGYACERCHDAKGVYRLISRKSFEVLVLDLDLTDRTDLDVVSYVRRQSPDTQIVLIFDIHQVERAIENIRRGAFFYLPKSCQPSDVALIVGKAVRVLRAEAAAQQYERSVFEGMVGTSPAMKRVLDLIRKVAPTDSTVLLLGESGTGKELLANAIHRLSPRREKPFIAINCAALPEQLLESEMFGHVKGAFTGAEANKRGLFEEADGGTIFLDEVGEMALSIQAKLLRVLQNGEIRAVGGSRIHRVDVRVLAATNRDLVEAVERREFREDLYFRLNVIQIVIPPLRERLDALPSLVDHFLKRYNRKFNRSLTNIDSQAWTLLQNYDYPGNVRELESIIAHAVILSDDDTIRVEDLPDQVRYGQGRRLALPHYAQDDIPTLQEMEKRLIQTALERLNGNQSEAAKRMGISRSTLWRKMKEYGISKVESGAAAS